MKGNANLILGAVIALVGLYALTRAEKAAAAVVEGVTEGARRFREGLLFDRKTLGPGVELTGGAAMGMQEMIARGYMTPDGQITAAGMEYIERERMAQQVAAAGGGT